MFQKVTKQNMTEASSEYCLRAQLFMVLPHQITIGLWDRPNLVTPGGVIECDYLRTIKRSIPNNNLEKKPQK